MGRIASSLTLTKGAQVENRLHNSVFICTIIIMVLMGILFIIQIFYVDTVAKTLERNLLDTKMATIRKEVGPPSGR